jgi:glycerol-3-phosphate acyltransferase PlsY
MTLPVLFIFSFVLGAVPVSFIAGKLLRGIDIRQHGSGNPGATNAFRVLGPVPGVITFLLDALKGLIPVAIGVHIGGIAAIGAGVAAIAGHMYTPFLGFRGGKGVATSAGVFAALLPVPTALALAAFAVVLAVCRYVSAGSIVAACVLPLSAWYLHAAPERVVCAFIVGGAIIFKHRANVRRLLDGTESKISFTRKNT